MGICSSTSLTWVIPKTSWPPVSPQAAHRTDAGLIFQQLSVVFRDQHLSLGPGASTSAWGQGPPRSHPYTPLLPPLSIPTSPPLLETSILSHLLPPAHNDREHLHSTVCPGQL